MSSDKNAHFSTRKTNAALPILGILLLGLLAIAGCGEDEVFDQVGSIKIGVGTASEMRIGETDIIYADVFDDEGIAFGVLRGFDPRDVKWKSVNSSTAEVSYLKETADVIAFNPNSSFAKVVGKKAGTATITAQYKGVSDSVQITVR